MKRSLTILLLFIIIVGTLTGCGPNQEKIQKDFYAILEEPASEDTIKEASVYLDKYIGKLDQEYAGQMVHELEHYILGFDQDGIDYKQWIEKYGEYLDPQLVKFYEIMAREQTSPMAEDAVLSISWSELAQRAYEIEQFISENKEYTMISDDLIWIYGNYINAMVMGTNGTPIFNYKTGEFDEEAKTVYASFINQHPDSVTAWVLTEYFTYLDSIQYTLNYKDKISSKLFFDTCDWLVSEAGKRVYQ